MAYIYELLGKHFQAVQLFKQVLSIHQKGTPADNAVLLQDLDNVIENYRGLSKRICEPSGDIGLPIMIVAPTSNPCTA